ncbi:MAG TPA: circularly permuted type 2 ATP-grasp protein, partial [Solirubrobacterales bacterium]|nr:circularly permuted type 2 ATP-grasp protein [Solirubrobacterales bacterium]
LDLPALRERVQMSSTRIGLSFGLGTPIAIDPIPRVIAAAEWKRIEAALMQRTRALNAFVADAYNGQKIFEAGAVPRRQLETSAGYEPCMRGLLDPAAPAAAVAGFDLVRGSDGELQVLEDNLRMPSGAAYATALRRLVEPALGAPVAARPLDGYAVALARTLGGDLQATSGSEAAAIVSDGPSSGAWFEHRELGRALELPVVTPGELESARGRLYFRIGRERSPLDAIYRRIDGDRLSEPDGSLTALGELLMPALQAGHLRCVNAFGTGIGDDKLAHAYLDRFVRFYLGEEPLLRSVRSYDLGDEAELKVALERLGELVIKPRDGFGGRGVTIMSRADSRTRRETEDLVRREPARFVAQETAALSTHPTVCDGRLQPRHVDLRPFVVSGRGWMEAMAGGLTRFAPAAGEMIVNSSRGGGCKDTWVLEAATAETA